MNNLISLKTKQCLYLTNYQKMLFFISISAFALALTALIISFKADAHSKDAEVLMTFCANEQSKLEIQMMSRLKLAKFLYDISKDLIHNQKPHD